MMATVFYSPFKLYKDCRRTCHCQQKRGNGTSLPPFCWPWQAQQKERGISFLSVGHGEGRKISDLLHFHFAGCTELLPTRKSRNLKKGDLSDSLSAETQGGGISWKGIPCAHPFTLHSLLLWGHLKQTRKQGSLNQITELQGTPTHSAVSFCPLGTITSHHKSYPKFMIVFSGSAVYELSFVNHEQSKIRYEL